MTARNLRVRILQSIVLCGLLAAGVLTAWAFVPEKQPEPPDLSQKRAIQLGNWRHQEVCPTGHQTEIVMGSTHLHVDMRLIAGLALEDSQEVPDGCPSGPIFAQSITFDHIGGTKEYDALLVARGLPLNHMDLDRIVPERYRDQAAIPENPDRRVAIEGAGYVDDISTWPPLSSPSSRRYRLHYLLPPGAGPPTIVMDCRGDMQVHRWRYCDARYRYGDVLIKYEFRQETNFPHSKRQQAPVKEPDGFLAVDLGVRAWIGEMLRSEGETQ